MINLASQLERDEGFVGYAYTDSLGYLTIGFGRLVDKSKGGGITRDEARYLLKNDISRCAAEVESALPWTRLLDDARHGVLVNMAFNLGVGGLLGFRKFLKALEARDFVSAAVEMMDSQWAKQVCARATRLRDQILTGEWQ